MVKHLVDDHLTDFEFIGSKRGECPAEVVERPVGNAAFFIEFSLRLGETLYRAVTLRTNLTPPSDKKQRWRARQDLNLRHSV
jgi:hypothetical protein